MNIFLIWLIGWFILSIGYYIYNVYIDNEYSDYKKLCMWRSFWTGIFSWIGILIILVIFIVEGILVINEWIEDKLS